MPSSPDKPKKRELVRAILDFIFTFRNTRGDILDDRWLYSAEGVSLQPQDFYSSVEKQLASRKIPNLQILRVEFAEGGLLSNQRQYLRLMRERLAIDACAAPFGNHFFFSCRIVYIPALVRLWHLAVAFLFFYVIGGLLVLLLGFPFAVIALVALLFAIAAVFRNAGNTAFSNLDTLLLKIPVVSTIYEDWFRMETYYRVDTRKLYLSLLPELIRAAAEEVCGDKGLKLVEQSGTSPIMTDLHLPPR